MEVNRLGGAEIAPIMLHSPALRNWRIVTKLRSAGVFGV